MSNFVHLHVHTEYSLLDGASRIDKLIDRVKDLGMDSIAITDHGVMYGVVDFYKTAIKKGIKPILGCEVYISTRKYTQKDSSKDKNQYHLVLLAENNEGYSNLMKIVSEGFVNGFYYKPRVDTSVLKKYSKGVIALSACLAGEVQQHLLNDNYQEAKKIALEYNRIFGQGNYYLELQDHNIREQKIVNQKLIELSKDTGIPLVATNDVHYISKKDADVHDVLLCIQTGKTVQDEDRMSFPTSEFYLKSDEEMRQLFPNTLEAINNTVEISKRCNVKLDFENLHLPEYNVPKGYTNKSYLRELCNNGLKKRYNYITKDIRDRLEYELSVIESMGYVDYFLIVWDFIKYAKDNGIMVGPGRGSAAGSLVSYTLEIIDIDPIKYGLIFERFLNPERVTMPDIDIDFCYERREEVIDYVVEKYGEDKVAQIVTFGTMAARGAIRDVGRALNIPYGEVDFIAKQIPMEIGMTIDKALETNNKFRNLYEEDSKVKRLIDTSRAVEGLPRHTSTHAAGVVISKLPITEYVPLGKNKDSIITQFTMTELEELGLLKMDFLGLRNLTVIRNAVELIHENHNINIDFSDSNYDDENVYKMFSKGNTLGVFQFESPGMRQFLRELQPTCFENIVAANSLFRPGPMRQIPKYIKNKNNPNNIEYTHPKLEPILDVTYGCMVYQEQVMQIVRDIGGFSMGRSDLVRRAMGKKKMKVMEEERNHFIYGKVDDKDNIEIPGAIRNGVDEKTANKIYDQMIDFAKYAFNKSHSAAYAVLAYQTAWLKYYYPVEFMAALITSVMDSTNSVSLYIHECKRLGIEILPPDINESYAKFAVINGKIRFGLSAIKNVGLSAIKSIVKARNKEGKFTSLTQFCERVDSKCLNKRTIESLIKCGAFDSLGIARSQLLAVYEKVMKKVQQDRKNNLDGQFSLFDNDKFKKDTNYNNILPDIKEFDERKLLSMEKEMLGVYVSGHPLSTFEEQLNNISTLNCSELHSLNENLDNAKSDKSVQDGSIITIGGLVINKKTKLTKNKNMMAFVTLEDLFGTVELIVFPKTYEKYNNIIYEDSIIIVKGRLSLNEEDEPKIICDRIRPLVNTKKKKIYLKVPKKQSTNLLNNVKEVLADHNGDIPVYVYLEEDKKAIIAERDHWVNLNEKLINDLKSILGDNCVKVC